MFASIRDFFAKDQGSMAIEFVFTVPLFVVMISGVVDLGRVYVDQANYYSVARDTARIVSRHGMTETAAESYALSRIDDLSSASASVDVTTTSTDVTVNVSAPIDVLAKFGFLDFLDDARLTATIVHAIEPE